MGGKRQGGILGCIGGTEIGPKLKGYEGDRRGREVGELWKGS